MAQKILSVCGCSLTDYLYTHSDFNSPEVQPLLSKENGDGGVAIGKLVFMEDVQKFTGLDREAILKGMSNGYDISARNVGGPAIAGAINASQILYAADTDVDFYGLCGNDDTGKFIFDCLATTDVKTEHYQTIPGPTPCTYVFSDPSWHDGKGERSFVNLLGVAAAEMPDFPGESFFNGDILWFSATALVPCIHDRLGDLLRRGKTEGKINIVSTVFDFRSEKKSATEPWQLGNADSWQDMDLLIMDKDEALRISGKTDFDEAVQFFTTCGVSSFFITCGAKSFLAWSDGRFYSKTEGVLTLPVSALADQDLAEHPERRGDTTGCGDNFAGGIVASLFLQMNAGRKVGDFSIMESAAWGAASGGAACFQIGSMYKEKARGEKYAILERYVKAYLA